MGQSLKKHPGGRPTKYNRAFLDIAWDYIEHYSDHGDVVPSVAGLAQLVDCTRETLHVWANDETKLEFSNIYNKLKRAQEHALLNNGLTGKFNSNITKLVLGKHGYHDKQEVTAQIETKDVGNNELARRLAFVIAKGVTVEGECSDVTPDT